MPIVVPNQAEVNMLKLILDTVDKPTGDKLFIHIMKTNVVISDSTLLSALKASELTVDEYPADASTREVLPAEWTVLENNGIATANEKSLALRNDNAPFFIYGYFITKGTTTENGVLMWGENFPSPFSIPNGGSTVKLTLRLELD